MNFKTPAQSTLTAFVIAVTAALFLVFDAHAGEFFKKDGAALQGHDPVAYFTEHKPVKGAPLHQARYKGSTFHFASKAHRDAFVAEPAKYAPQYGGYCAFGMSKGYKAATDPAAFRVVDGKLCLNHNREVQTMWRADVPGFIVKADGHWPSVSSPTQVID
jgi:YHS domain-containing protein